MTRDIASWVDAFETHLSAGTLRPIALQTVGKVGWPGVIQGIQEYQNGKVDKKLVVRTSME